MISKKKRVEEIVERLGGTSTFTTNRCPGDKWRATVTYLTHRDALTEWEAKTRRTKAINAVTAAALMRLEALYPDVAAAVSSESSGDEESGANGTQPAPPAPAAAPAPAPTTAASTTTAATATAAAAATSGPSQVNRPAVPAVVPSAAAQVASSGPSGSTALVLLANPPAALSQTTGLMLPPPLEDRRPAGPSHNGMEQEAHRRLWELYREHVAPNAGAQEVQNFVNWLRDGALWYHRHSLDGDGDWRMLEDQPH